MPGIKTIFLIAFCLVPGTQIVNAQKIRNASGTASYRLEEDMSKDELKAKLRHNAIINAIEREYGTYVSQESFVDVSDGNTDFRIFGKTEIRGEWLKTTHEDFKEEIRKVRQGGKHKNELWMSLKISGLVRALTQPDIDLDYYAANCEKEGCRTDIFNNGDPLYLHFQTPIDGFLSIFVVERDSAYRLLPYQQMAGQYKDAVPIKSDTPYLFFSSEKNDTSFEKFSSLLNDDLVMLTSEPEEYVSLYLVFATHEFHHPALTAGKKMNTGYEIPKSLPANNLVRWLENNRIHDTNFYYRQVKLKIVS